MTCIRDITNVEALEREFESIRKVFASMKKDELPLRIEWGTKKACEEADQRREQVTVHVLNDTEDRLIIRLIPPLATPSLSHIDLNPRKMGVVFLRTRQLFFKIWPNNVVLFADYKEGVEVKTLSPESKKAARKAKIVEREIIDRINKSLLFVEHLEDHIKRGDRGVDPKTAKVMCKFCGKTIDQIADKEEKE